MLKRSLIGLGIALGVLATCSMLLVAGGVVGGMVGYVSARYTARQVLPHSLEQPAQPPQLSPEPPDQEWQWPMPFRQAPETLWGLVTAVRVTEVVPDSPADEAGLEVDDVIIAIDGKALDAEHGLSAAVHGHDPGDETVLTVIRRGDDTEVLEMKVTLGRDTDEEGEVVAYLGIWYRYLGAAALGIPRAGGSWD
ncbi:MAG TPA: PDZ domain-containing protein [Anaerolineae bacterium]|nr:PDZ domain-containing protein [Anaerolineae bacterium]